MTYQFHTGQAPPDTAGAHNVSMATPVGSLFGDTEMDEVFNYARTRISPNFSDPTALRNLMAHEIGHTMGLTDCVQCCPGTTVMAGVPKSSCPDRNCNYDAVEINHGIAGPTQCDTAYSSHAFERDATEEVVTEPAGGSGGGGTPQEPVDHTPEPSNCYHYYYVTYMYSTQSSQIIIVSAQYLGTFCD